MSTIHHDEAPVASSHNAPSVKRPVRWLTIVVTAFFGVFGLIPAIVGRNNARRAGRDNRGYFKAFWLTMASGFVAWVVIIVVAVVTFGGSSSTSGGGNAGQQAANTVPNGNVLIQPNMADPVLEVRAIEGYYVTALKTRSVAMLNLYTTAQINPLRYRFCLDGLAQGYTGSFPTYTRIVIEPGFSATHMIAKLYYHSVDPRSPSSGWVINEYRAYPAPGGGYRMYFEDQMDAS